MSLLNVQNDVMPDGSYGVTIHVGEDTAWALSRDDAIEYAVTVVTSATQAEHDAALFRLLVDKLNMPEAFAATFIKEQIRADRPMSEKGRLHFTPALSKRGPYLKVVLDGRMIGEVEIVAARRHAEAVLTAFAAADLDAALTRALVGMVGLDRARAYAVIADLQNYWPHGERGE